MRAQIPSALAAVEASLRPASQTEIVTMLTRLLAHFPLGDRSAAQVKILLADYASDLAELPADILNTTAERYRRDGKFWPKVAELIDIAEPMLARRQAMRWRLQRLAAIKEPEVERESPEERARRAAAVDEILRGLPQVAGI